MLKEACAYKMALNQYCQLYLEHENIFISDDRWTLLKIIRDFLEVFHDATLFFFQGILSHIKSSFNPIL